MNYVNQERQELPPADDLLKLTAPKRSGLLLGGALVLLLVAATFFGGLQMGTKIPPEANLGALFLAKPTVSQNVDLDEFWRVWKLLDKKFVAATGSDVLSDQEKIYAAIDGLVDGYGDPYTVFLPPDDTAAFADDIAGNFGGVGMEVGMRKGRLTVIAPLPDTPAEMAGIISGDVIVKIDDVATNDLRIDEAVKLIRGEVGTEVVLTLLREGENELLSIGVMRDVINVPTVETKRQGDIFIISLFSFNALAEQKMQLALREYIESGADYLILDVRGNPGGFMQSAISIAGYFLPLGKVVMRESYGARGGERLYRSQGRTLRGFAPKKIVVLIDSGSASASEILAGALSEHGVATLIGEQTFGKGSVQELIDLAKGSSLKVTIARWQTPEGISISDAGLVPDIEIERTVEQFLADEDPQLEAALEFLNQND